jgi:hypothetical protein
MNRVLKTFVLWLLMFAFSMQGVAAAAQISCGPDHHGTIASLSMHHHDLTSHGTHHHYHDGNALADAGQSDISADTGKQLGASQCSACAACCVGAIIAPSFMSWDTAHNGSHPVLVPPPIFVSGHIPDGLKRPPRGSLV